MDGDAHGADSSGQTIAFQYHIANRYAGFSRGAKVLLQG